MGGTSRARDCRESSRCTIKSPKAVRLLFAESVVEAETLQGQPNTSLRKSLSLVSRGSAFSESSR